MDAAQERVLAQRPSIFLCSCAVSSAGRRIVAANSCCETWGPFDVGGNLEARRVPGIQGPAAVRRVKQIEGDRFRVLGSWARAAGSDGLGEWRGKFGDVRNNSEW